MSTRTTRILLQLALAFALLYAAISGFLNPDSWVGYYPGFVRNFIDPYLLLIAGEIVQILIALWILSGRKIFIPSAITGLFLLGIVAFNLNQMEVLFRDISLALAAFALSALSLSSRRENAILQSNPGLQDKNYSDEKTQ